MRTTKISSMFGSPPTTRVARPMYTIVVGKYFERAQICFNYFMKHSYELDGGKHLDQMKLWLCTVNGQTYQYVVTINQIIQTLDVQLKHDENSKCVHIDESVYHYLIKELFLSKYYRINFLYKWCHHDKKYLSLKLVPTNYNLIDYKWNQRVYQMVRERSELDHTLSWLSTLGGGFSALGDYFSNCAEIAGEISIHQLQLGFRLGDPNITARCRLYLSLSLLQRKKFKTAKSIIYKEYCDAKNATVIDHKLLNMCRGIWAKLQYEHYIYQISRKG